MLVAGGAGDRDPEPSGEATAAPTAALVEEPLAAGAAFVEDIEAVGAVWQRQERGLLTASPEGTLPAGGAAIRAGAVAALVRLATELADA